jgi:hypothetical protein
VLLAAVTGPPIPGGLPSAAAVQAWVSDPLHPSYAAATARASPGSSGRWWPSPSSAASPCSYVGCPARLRRMAAYLPPPVQGLTATRH